MGLPARSDRLRVSDAERAEAVVQLQDALLTGRLTLTEFEGRCERALRARRAGELADLIDDLPAEPALPPLASWSRRSLALGLDHLLLLAVLAPALTAVAAAIGLANATVVVALASPLVAVGYFTVAHGGRSGRTIGERACGIAVRRDPHRSRVARRAGYGQSFGRALMLYLFAGLALSGVGLLNFLWPLWDVKRQAWHDKVAGTIVVRADALDFDRRRWAHRWQRILSPSLRRWIYRAVHGPSCAFEDTIPRQHRLPWPPR